MTAQVHSPIQQKPSPTGPCGIAGTGTVFPGTLIAPDRALRSPIVFIRITGEHDWYVGEFAGVSVYLRENTMPSDNPYSLWLGNDRYLELPALPSLWSFTPGKSPSADTVARQRA